MLEFKKVGYMPLQGMGDGCWLIRKKYKPAYKRFVYKNTTGASLQEAIAGSERLGHFLMSAGAIVGMFDAILLGRFN